MAIDWDALYELAPSDTTYVKDTDDAIRSLKTATRERVTKEHEFDLASQARQGLHRAGSAVAFYQASAPTQRNGVDLSAADAGILFVDSDDKSLKFWDGDSFEGITIPYEDITGIVGIANSVHSASITYGSLFTSMSPSIPSINDSMLLVGGRAIDTGSTDVIYTYSKAVRTSSTEITLYGVYIEVGAGTTAGLQTLVVTSGSGTTIPGSVSLAWR
jgi:hypothetical protein